jgi:carbon storage regulator CsrA
MLVLSRKTEESVVVGDGPTRLLKVTVLAIRSGIVKLGFEAADDVTVHRAEVWNRLATQDWGTAGPDREIPSGALAESLLGPRRELQESSPSVGRQVGKSTRPGKRLP